MPALDQKTRYDSDEDSIANPNQGLSSDELKDLERNADIGALEDGYNAPSIDDEDRNTNQTAEEDEQSQLDESAPEDTSSNWKTNLNEKRRFRVNKKQAATGGVAIGLLAGGMFGIMTVMPSMRLESYMARINEKAFGVAQSAVEARASNLFRMYLTKKLLSFDESCGATVSSKCRGNFKKSGIATSLFEGWSEKNFEGRLFNKLGYEIEYLPNSSSGNPSYRLTPNNGKPGGPVDLDLTRLSDPDFMKNAGGNKVGKEFRKLLKQETKMLSIMDRISLRRGLKAKYDIDIWCFLACDTKDNLKAKKIDAKRRFQKAMIEHVAYKFSGKYGVYFDCIMKTSEFGTGSGCTHDDINDKGKEKLDDKALQEILDEFNPDLPDGTPGNAVGKKFSQIIIEKVVTKITNEATGKAASSAIPVAGQVYAALSMLDLVDQMWTKMENNELSKLAADLNASQYAQYYTSMRSTNDEFKSHNLTLGEVGAVMEPFKGAEESQVYQANNPVRTNILTYLLGGSKAYAATTENNEAYKCANDKPIPEGELVCEEKKVAREFFIDEWADNAVISGGMEALLTQYRAGQDGDCTTCPRFVVHNVLSGINWTIDKITEGLLSSVMSTAENIPGLSGVIETVEMKLGELMQFVFEKIFPLPIQLDSVARELLDGLYAGGDVVASEFAKGGYDESGESYGLGGKALTPEETAAILKDQAEQDDYEYSQKSFLARAGDLSRPDSLGTQIVMATPESLDEIPQTISSNIAGLFNGNLINNLATSLFGARPAYAAVSEATINSPFGVAKYGIPLDDPSLNIDPEELTPEKCEQYKNERKASEEPNETTGFPEYSTVDPCLLTQVVAESAGSMFTDAYDEGNSGESQPVESGPLPEGTVTEADTEVTTQGGGIRLHKSIVAKADEMLAAAAADGVTLTGSGWRSPEKQIELRKKNCPDWQNSPSSACSPPTAKPGSSNHEKGLAIDFSNMCYPNATCPGNPGYEWLMKNAEKYGFFKLSSEAWHWSVDGS